jgi:hypothetical protein
MRRITELLRVAASPARSARQNRHDRPPDTRRNSEFLNGWKEIAAYLGRSVRTVQRWERLSGLPVHRPSLPSPSVVIGSRVEIRDWVLREVGSRTTSFTGPHPTN